MAPWWSYGGYVLPVVVKPENLTFHVKFDLEGQRQFPPKTIGILINIFCTSSAKLVILAWIDDGLWCGKARNGVNFDFKLNLTLKVKVDYPPPPPPPPPKKKKKKKKKKMGTLTKVFCIFGPNLVSLAWTVVELSRGQTWWRMGGRTDGRMQETTIPGGKNWPRVKTTMFPRRCLNQSLICVLIAVRVWKSNQVYITIHIYTINISIYLHIYVC